MSTNGSTTTMLTFIHPGNEDNTYAGYGLPLNVETYGVPLAFTVLVVLILCIVIAYTKAKRRQQRRLQGPRNNLRSISGGVPMNVSAYRNYGAHLAAGDPNLQPAPGGGFYPPGDLPPPYEVAIQTPPSTSSSQTFSSSVSLLPAPPAYIETIHQQPAPNHSTSNINNAPAIPTTIQTSVPNANTTTTNTESQHPTTPTGIVGQNMNGTLQPTSSSTLGVPHHHLLQGGQHENDAEDKKDRDEPEVDCDSGPLASGPKPESADSSYNSQNENNGNDHNSPITTTTMREEVRSTTVTNDTMAEQVTSP